MDSFDDYIGLFLLACCMFYIMGKLLKIRLTKKKLGIILLAILGLFSLNWLAMEIPFIGVYSEQWAPMWLMLTFWLTDRKISFSYLLYSAFLAYFTSGIMPTIILNFFPLQPVYSSMVSITSGTILTLILGRLKILDLFAPANIPKSIRVAISLGFIFSFFFMKNKKGLNYSILALAAILMLLLTAAYKLGTYFQEKRSQKETYHNLLLYTQELETLNSELASFKHDYINVLLSMEKSLHQENLPQAKEIFYDTVYPAGDQIRVQKNNIQKYTSIKIPELRNLLITKELYAKEKGLVIKLETIGEIEDIPVAMNDFVSVIDIILEEAIETLLGAGSSEPINLSLIKVEDDFSFSCEYSGVIQDYAGKKRFNQSHLLGQYSLKQIMNRNEELSLTTELGEGSITQTVFISNSRR